MSYSLHAAVIEYLDDMTAQGMKHGTLTVRRSVLLRLCKHHPDRKLRSLTAGDLYRFLYGANGIARNRSGITASCQRNSLKRFLEYAKLMAWIKEAPDVPLPHVPSQRSVKSPPTRLTEGQLLLLLDTAEPNPRLWGMLAVAMNTGLRISDVLKIRMGDLNFQAGSLAVWVQKTEKYDAMPVTLNLDEALRSYLLWYTQETGATLADVDAYLFPGFAYAHGTGRKGWPGWKATTGRPPTYAWAHLKIKELLAETGIPVEQREAWHTIRRSVARIYFDRLRDQVSRDHALRQTSALLGHTKASTTETYLGMSAEVEARDESMRGKRFLGNGDVGNTSVSRLPRRAGNG